MVDDGLHPLVNVPVMNLVSAAFDAFTGLYPAKDTLARRGEGLDVHTTGDGALFDSRAGIIPADPASDRTGTTGWRAIYPRPTANQDVPERALAFLACRRKLIAV